MPIDKLMVIKTATARAQDMPPEMLAAETEESLTVVVVSSAGTSLEEPFVLESFVAPLVISGAGTALTSNAKFLPVLWFT